MYYATTPIYQSVTPTYQLTSPNDDSIGGMVSSQPIAFNPISPEHSPQPSPIVTSSYVAFEQQQCDNEIQKDFSATAFSHKKIQQKYMLKFPSIEERLFQHFMNNKFCMSQVHNAQNLTRGDVIAIADNNDKIVWPIDRLFNQRKWVLCRRLTKSHIAASDCIDYNFTAECHNEDTNIMNFFFEQDMLPPVKLSTTSYDIYPFDISAKLHNKFQECQELTVCWCNHVLTQPKCKEYLEKIIHKNGRYDYNYNIVWELENDVDHAEELALFEKFIKEDMAPTITVLLEDIHLRQIWCDSMLTLKATRLFKIYNDQTINNISEDAISTQFLNNLRISPKFMAHKLDGERCFGFLSSNGLLVISSTAINSLYDQGLKNLKQVYYVVVERLENNQFFIIDIIFILRFTSNLNPNFTSNNKMFETNLCPINVNIIDSIKFMNRLPVEVIRKNIYTEITNPNYITIHEKDPTLTYDGMLAIMDKSIYKIKKNQTVELEICLRSLLVDKLNEPKPQTMHKFLKQWKKQKIIVAEELFEAFTPSDLKDIFKQVFVQNKDKYTLTPINWGKYIKNPKEFIQEHFSTHSKKRQYVNTPDHIQTLEIFNTRVIVEFKCIVTPATLSSKDMLNTVHLEYLRKRYDKLHADSAFKVKSIITNLQKNTAPPNNY